MIGRRGTGKSHGTARTTDSHNKQEDTAIAGQDKRQSALIDKGREEEKGTEKEVRKEEIKIRNTRKGTPKYRNTSRNIIILLAA